jgi:hypothetical protein
MATLARRVGGMGLDSVIAMTGHKDLKLGDMAFNALAIINNFN